MKYDEIDEIKEYCMHMPCVYESRPFGVNPICYRVSGKIFCQLTESENWFKVTLKTNPEAADMYRQIYPGVLVRGYHCPPVQQPYWNTVELYKIPGKVLYQMLDEAYDEVVAHLPKKERDRIAIKSRFSFIKTEGQNSDFLAMCAKLDDNLEELVGTKIDRSKYHQYNVTDKIHDAIVIYEEDTPVGCGAYRFYDEETVELKRVFLEPKYRGHGLAGELLLRLEADARIQGYRYAVLETAHLLEASVHLYERAGYKVIPNYGPYADMPESLCMRKKL